MSGEKQNRKAWMILNGLALIVIANNLTSPLHELTHMLTQMAAGMQACCLSFGAAETVGTVKVNMDSVFWKIMYEGSAALMNIVVGFLCLLLLKKCRFKPLSRVLMLQLTIMHLSMGFGYFLRDGVSYTPGGGMGDWSKVLERFGGSVPLRIGLLVVGTVGFLLTFYIAYRQAFHFIRDNEDKAERRQVTAAIYLFPYLFNAVVITLLGLRSPLGAENALVIGGIVNIFGMIPFFWGYMFVAHMVKPRKDNVWYFSPCAEKKIGLWIFALALLVFDALILCPGIWF